MTDQNANISGYDQDYALSIEHAIRTTGLNEFRIYSTSAAGIVQALVHNISRSQPELVASQHPVYLFDTSARRITDIHSITVTYSDCMATINVHRLSVSTLKFYLMFEVGECNDALRDRTFYLLQATSLSDAHDQILEHKLEQQDDTCTPYTMEEVIECWDVLITSEEQLEIRNLEVSITEI